MAEIWTIQRVLTWTTDYFKRKGLDAPRLTAELLLAKVLGCTRVKLYTDFDRPLNKDELAGYRGLMERRVAGEPTHYLLGQKEFCGRPFAVDARVLIPRPETEQLVEEVLARLPAESAGPVLDLCTGSGCIGLTLAAERPSLKVVLTDQSAEALEVARQNAQALGVAERAELIQGDLFAPLAGRRFAAIASNPPYVASAKIETLAAEVKREPRAALDGGADGLSALRLIAAQAQDFLEPGGLLALEMDEDEGAAVRALLEAQGWREVAILQDFAKLDRFALARRP